MSEDNNQTENKFPEDGAVVSGTDGQETIVYDTDENGNTIGWHKEAN